MKTNNKKFYELILTGVAISMVAVFLLSSPVAAANLPDENLAGGPGGNSRGGTGISTSPLTQAEVDGLTKAILEEYRAFNLYKSVIAQLGNVEPFDWIVDSEQQHISALTRQAEKYGITIPANPGLTEIPIFADLALACQAGVKAETEDAALYDTLKMITTHTDVLRVYDNLQTASLQNHLTAFEVCD